MGRNPISHDICRVELTCEEVARIARRTAKLERIVRRTAKLKERKIKEMPEEKANGTTMAPTLHKPVPMGARVTVPRQYSGKELAAGTVAGIATRGVIYFYIVVMDEPIFGLDGEEFKAISVPGTNLADELGNKIYAIT